MFHETALPSVVVVQPRLFRDERGWFFESWSARTTRELVGDATFVQDNHSSSDRGVLRGLHYQLPPSAQGKLVRCGRGRVWDVAVDVRRDSDTFGEWVGEELSADNHRQLWIPPGFAHGFLALTDHAELLYKATAPYDPATERSIAWDDPDLAIDWPLDGPPLLSDKDAAAPALADADVFDASPGS